jgi:hypothetical protein
MTEDTEKAALEACKKCGYSVTPDEVYFKERKHFHGHAYQCVRCLYQSEAGSTWDEARALWNTRAAYKQASASSDVRNAALEEAAKVAEDAQYEISVATCFGEWSQRDGKVMLKTTSVITEDIRALKRESSDV